MEMKVALQAKALYERITFIKTKLEKITNVPDTLSTVNITGTEKAYENIYLDKEQGLNKVAKNAIVSALKKELSDAEKILASI